MLDYDGAEPSNNSVSALNLLRLYFSNLIKLIQKNVDYIK